jgi:hypothetical protein
MPEDIGYRIGQAVELAWCDFAADMERRYPAAEWSGDRLRERRDGLLADADKAAEADRATEVGEMRAEARAIGAVLAQQCGDGRRRPETAPRHGAGRGERGAGALDDGAARRPGQGEALGRCGTTPMQI